MGYGIWFVDKAELEPKTELHRQLQIFTQLSALIHARCVLYPNVISTISIWVYRFVVVLGAGRDMLCPSM